MSILCQFKKLGFDSTDMFKYVVLMDAQSGTFSVDKLGDTIKEFSIRSYCMVVTTTQEGFKVNRVGCQ